MTPGRLLVLFCWLAASTASPLAIDLDADTDQTGLVEHSVREEELEDASGTPGLIVLPNWDDDDLPGAPGHGVPDCLVENRFARIAFPNRASRFDDVINGAADRDEDMQRLTLRRTAAIPSRWRIVLRTSPEDAQKIRVFSDAGSAVIGPRNTGIHYEHEVANLRNEVLTYYVEGIAPGASFRIELVATEDGQEQAKDAVRGRVAPFLLAPNERPVRQAVVPDFRGVPPSFRMVLLPGLDFEEDAVRAAAATLVHTTTAPPTDSFWQDGFQPGYASAPGPERVRTMILLARFPKNATNFIHPAAQPPIPPEIVDQSRKAHWLWPNYESEFFTAPGAGAHPALLGPGVGVFEMPELPDAEAQDPVNHGGNIEVTWPLAGAPFGRLVAGKQMSAVYREFLRQQAQAPLLELDLGFLLVKHVDEVAYFLSKQRIAVPDPELGRELLAGFYRDHPDPSKALFLKGREVAKGTLTAVHESGDELTLTDASADLAAVRPGMYLHVYQGKARYQTYDVLRATRHAITVQGEAAAYFSYWRDGPVEAPAAGSRYIVVEKPLHDTRSRVLLVTISELLDTSNPKVRSFWEENASAARAIASLIRPQLASLSPARVLELPVLFHRAQSSGAEGLTAFTPNLVNGHLFGTTFLLQEPLTLRLPSGEDLFGQAAARTLASAGLKAQFVDGYFRLHNLFGGIHCGPNLILQPPRAPAWWK